MTARAIDINEGPTCDECSSNAPVLVNGATGFAIWYPQMGGYGGVAVLIPSGTCFDVLVWHDGEFPFSDAHPREIHHCKAEQFIQFGETAQRLVSLGERAAHR